MDKKKNMKIYITFITLLIVCLFGGYFAGTFAANIQGKVNMIDWNVIAQSMYIPLIVFFIILGIVAYGFCFILLKQAQGKYKTLENASDEIFETEIINVEKKLNITIIVNNILLLISFLLFPLIVLCGETITDDIGIQNGLYAVTIIYTVMIVLFTTVYTFIIKLEKKINPEKKGNPFDIHFRKQWLKSMDEAELMKNALGSQKACTAGIKTGIALWVISFVSMLVFHTGILPIICIVVMIGVMIFVQAINSN